MFVSPFVAFWPVISKLYSENRTSQIEVEMRKIVRIVTFLVIPMFFIFIFVGYDLLSIFGNDYATKESYFTLLILSSAFLIDAISGPIGSILTMTKYAKLVLYNNVLVLLINIFLNFILYKSLGIIGIAIATGISVIIGNIISIIEVKILLKIFAYDYRILFQALALCVLNLIFCFILKGFINFDNIFLDIVSFGLLIYLINVIALVLTQWNIILKFVSGVK